MCCIIAFSLLYRSYRRDQALKARQRALHDSVLFYADLMLREGHGTEDIIRRGVELFDLERILEAEVTLSKVMRQDAPKAGKREAAPYVGDCPDSRSFQAAVSLRRIVGLCRCVHKFKTSRYRNVRLSAASEDAHLFIEPRSFPVFVPQEPKPAVQQEVEVRPVSKAAGAKKRRKAGKGKKK